MVKLGPTPRLCSKINMISNINLVFAIVCRMSKRYLTQNKQFLLWPNVIGVKSEENRRICSNVKVVNKHTVRFAYSKDELLSSLVVIGRMSIPTWDGDILVKCSSCKEVSDGKDCTVCDKHTCYDCLSTMSCDEHWHCDDWECIKELSWDCERGNCEATGNCVYCSENCDYCNRPPGIEGVYEGGWNPQ